MYDGYPAYAGIDLTRHRHLRTTYWLPRIRGDRPLGGGGEDEGKKGYPAYAGIDPRKQSCQFWWTRLPRIRGDRPGQKKRLFSRFWLPRIRGDRPHIVLIGRLVAEATPHKRGSTHTVSHHSHSISGLPRIRGDRPIVVSISGGKDRATPHTRGSTVYH